MRPEMAAALTDPAVIKVCIIDDHVIVRAGLRMLLESNARMSVLWETSSASLALEQSVAGPPDVILLDLDLGTENGLNFISDLVEKFRPCRVLVLTAIHDTQAQLAAVAAGASGVVVKEQAPETLLQAIETVHGGESWLGRSLMAAVMGRFSRDLSGEKKDPEAEKIATLTPREKEIVTLVSDGFNGEKIAKQLGISEATVRNHLTSILAKLELSNKFELAVYALRHGLGNTRKS
jgi:two-component system nitrate/nitrite response regulator NarL